MRCSLSQVEMEGVPAPTGGGGGRAMGADLFPLPMGNTGPVRTSSQISSWPKPSKSESAFSSLLVAQQQTPRVRISGWTPGFETAMRTETRSFRVLSFERKIGIDQCDQIQARFAVYLFFEWHLFKNKSSPSS